MLVSGGVNVCHNIFLFPKNKGIPKWMVKIMENPIKMDDLGIPTPIFGNTHILCSRLL